MPQMHGFKCVGGPAKMFMLSLEWGGICVSARHKPRLKCTLRDAWKIEGRDVFSSQKLESVGLVMCTKQPRADFKCSD